ncbi:MAG TPA: adenylate/guanylate cyclase domain-containing protein, partial [Sphingomicrobium sp.]|nr:adenylate/guanylate cyclase domain-containing protein [Sphingomicrobium sp.]
MTHDGGTGSSSAEPALSQRAGERRQMTIMFYDLVGSTALASNCDPEDFGEAVARFHDAVSGAVRSLGGYVGSRVGDGAVVYFGYPEAQEDAAERAVLAGLRAVTATRRLLLPDGETARIRVGIATGEGIINRSESGEGNEVVGNVANLAARLQSFAPPQSVIVSDGTRRVLGGSFELVDIGEIDVKGFAAPVQAWRVADQPQRDPVELKQQSAPLVGRSAERAAMGAALDRALSGESSVLLVIGDAGVGKSHLSTAFVMDDHAVSVIRLVFSCAAHSRDTPFHPFMPQLSRAASGASAWASGTDSDDAAMLARIAGFESRNEALQGLTAAQRLERTIDALVRQFELFSRQQPLIILFEDAHWADPTSLTVLERAIRDGTFGQALLIVTARGEFDPAWAQLPNVQTIRLRPLESSDADNLVLSVPGADSLPPSIRRAILRRADGIPLFLEELTRSTVERASDGAGISVDEFDLPMSLQDSLLARLDRLGPAKRIAQVASVIGRRFTSEVLAD